MTQIMHGVVRHNVLTPKSFENLLGLNGFFSLRHYRLRYTPVMYKVQLVECNVLARGLSLILAIIIFGVIIRCMIKLNKTIISRNKYTYLKYAYELHFTFILLNRVQL